MTAVVFDTETTGLVKHPRAKDSVQPAIIEFGACLVERGEIVDEIDILINPGYALPPKITKITGLTDEVLSGEPRFPEVVARIRPFFERADVMVAHNLPFDKGMLSLDLARAGMLADWPWPPGAYCTVQEHAEFWGYRPNLQKLYQWYFGEPLDQSHRALDDVHALVRVANAAGVLS